MARKDDVVVGEGEDACLDLLDERGVVATRQVGATDTEMEQRVAGEDSLILGHHEAHTPRAMSWHIAALYLSGEWRVESGELDDVSIINLIDFQVVHIVHSEAHDTAVSLGLPQQSASLGMHGDWQLEMLAHLPQPCDVVHMGVRQQDMFHRQALGLDILQQLRVLKRRLAGGIHDDTHLRLVVDDNICINLEMVECKLLNHCCAL